MVQTGANSAASPVLLPPGVKSERPDPLVRAYDLPCTLVLEMPALDFSIGTLLGLEPGDIVVTNGQQNEDLPLRANGQLVGLVEVDVVGNRLAVRITGLA
jgi:flagellar motor switch/type III secretory pathway protein FliN